jgi:hypothetical protein
MPLFQFELPKDGVEARFIAQEIKDWRDFGRK